MSKPTLVIKIGGNELNDPAFVQQLAEAIKAHQQNSNCILVHGGGKAINRLMEAMEVKPVYKDGQRVTDAATLEIAEMVLSGKINKQLVLALLTAGVEAAGVSGIDRKLLQVEPWGEDMDLVGRIVHVRAELLEQFFSDGVVPIISPISIGPAGRYNVNADHAAGMIAGAIHADRAVFISNVPGVIVNEQVTPSLSKSQVEQLIENGTINKGMIPKVNAALDALEFGAQQTTITNLAGFQNNTGTTFTTERTKHGNQN